jgi:recombinational DNA repair protein (RecF pathway)
MAFEFCTLTDLGFVPKSLMYHCARHAGRIESDAVYQESEAPVCEEAYNALATGIA